MKNAAPLLALIAVVVAASLFFLRETGPGPTHTDLDRAGVETVTQEDAAAPDDNDLADVAAVDARDVREAAPIADVAPAAQLDQAADEEAPEARATLVGRVIDAGGRPIAAAEVRLSTTRGDMISRLTFDLNGRAEDTIVHTGSDGRFETTVPAGEVRIGVGHDGFAPLERDLALAAGERMDVGDMRLAEGVHLLGRVVDAGGNGVANASVTRKPKSEGGVQVFGGRPAPAVATTDGTGRFEVVRQAPGPYDFVVAHDEHPARSFSGRTERAGETRDGIVVTLQDGATIAGRVVDLPQSGAQDLRVSARPDSGDGAGFWFDTRPGGPVTARVDDSGRFVLKGLEPGFPVRVQLLEGRQSWDGSSRRSRDVAAQPGDRDVKIAYSKGSSVRFRVVDGAGTPLESLEVSAGFNFAMQRVRRDQVTENGEVTLGSMWPDEGGETLRLEIEATGFEPYRGQGIVVLPGDDRDLGTIALKPRPQVMLTVRDRETNAPVAGAIVTMRPYTDPTATRRSVRRRISIDVDDDGDEEEHSPFEVSGEVRGTTDEEGLVALDATPGKTVEFLLQHSGYAETVDGPLVVSTSGSLTEHDVALDLGGSVRVTVLDAQGTPIEGTSVERRSAERKQSMHGETQSDTTDASGVVTLAGLPAGELFFRLKPADLGGGGGMFRMDLGGLGGGPGAGEDDGKNWTSVVVNPGETSELSLLAPMRGALRGTVLEVGVPLAGASITLRRPEQAQPAGVMSFGPQGPKAISDARGEFRFDGVEEGDYELVVSHATRAMEEVWPVEAEGRETRVEIDLDVTIVEGGVYDENGDPVFGALVRPEKVSSEGGQQQKVIGVVMLSGDGEGGSGTVITMGGTNANEALTDEDGQYSLRGITAGLKIEITATADGYDEARSKAFEVDAGATRVGVDIQFTTPGKIVVTIENGPGRGMVMLRRSGGFRGQPRVEQFTGSEVTVDGVAPGDWTVRLMGGPSGDIDTDPDEVEVTVVAGETVTAAFVVR